MCVIKTKIKHLCSLMGKLSKNVMSLQVHLHRSKFQLSPNRTLARTLNTFPSPMQLRSTAGPRSAPNDQKKSTKASKAFKTRLSHQQLPICMLLKRRDKPQSQLFEAIFLDIHRYLQNSEKSESPNTSFCSLFYKLKWNKVKLDALLSVQAVPHVPITVYLVSCFRAFCL